MLFKHLCLSLTLGVFVLLLHSTTYGEPFLNRIDGVVVDPDNNPVENVRVELQNEINTSVGNTKTDSSGRFSFIGMVAGRYTVYVRPFGTNFAEDSKEVYITNISARSASDFAFVEFQLRLDKRVGAAFINTPAEVIFIQDVPPDAKRMYEAGRDDLKKNRESNLEQLDQAIKIFPTYFDALNLLGETYFARKDYGKAYPYMIRAIDVNQRSFQCYYRLAFSFVQIKQYPAAIEAARAATSLGSQSAAAHLVLGTALRLNGKLEDAEKSLLKADELSGGKDAETQYQLALVYNRLNRNEDAVKRLEAYLKLDPSSPDKSKIKDLIAKLKTAKS